MRRFVSPYKIYLIWAVVLNVFSAIFNIFSFTLIIPILQILFKMDNTVYEFIPWDAEMETKDILLNKHHRHIRSIVDTAYPRTVPRTYDSIEDKLLFRLVRDYGTAEDRYSKRHKDTGIQ